MGVGSRLLKEVEFIAKNRGYEKVTLAPSPLDDGCSQAKLIRWYKSRGYEERPECASELEKSVV